jgi:hypothetical protein
LEWWLYHAISLWEAQLAESLPILNKKTWAYSWIFQPIMFDCQRVLFGIAVKTCDLWFGCKLIANKRTKGTNRAFNWSFRYSSILCTDLYTFVHVHPKWSHLAPAWLLIHAGLAPFRLRPYPWLWRLWSLALDQTARCDPNCSGTQLWPTPISHANNKQTGMPSPINRRICRKTRCSPNINDPNLFPNLFVVSPTCQRISQSPLRSNLVGCFRPSCP